MKPECKAAIERAAQQMGLSRIPKLDDIDNKIREHRKQLARKDRQAYLARTAQENLELAGKAALDEAIHEAVKKRQRAEATVISRDKRYKLENSMVSRGLSHIRALGHMTLFNADGRGNTVSMEKLIQGRASSYKAKLDQLWELQDDSSILGVIATKEGQKKFLDELYGTDTGDAAVKRAVKQFETINKQMIDDFNARGGDLTKLVDWRLPQALNQYRLSKMTKEQFADTWMELVDRNKYVNPDGSLMDDAAMRTFLKESYTTLVNGTKKDAETGGGKASIANRHEGHRQIHYKSSDAYTKAMELAGNGNVWEQIHAHIDGMSRDIQLLESFGPNPDHEFQLMYDRAKRLDGGVESNEALNIKRAFDMLTGNKAHDLSVGTKHFIGELKASFVASRLGSMVISQIADLGTIAATARAMNIPMMSIMENAAKYMGSKEYRSSVRSMGFAMESMAHSIARFADDASSYGSMSKIAGLVVQAQGATAWNNMWRGAFGAAMAHKMSDLNSRFADLASLSEHDRLVLESKGVSDRDWSLWKLAQRDANGTMTQGTIGEIPLDQIHQLIPERIAEIQQRGQDLLDKINAKNDKELGWLSGRENKIADYKQYIEDTIAKMEDVRSKRLDDITANDVRMAGELQLRLEQAQIEFEIFSKVAKENATDRASSFMKKVKLGVEQYGQRRSGIGETLGAKRHASKLAASANDRMLAREDKRLKDLANKLFGAEQVEEGIKTIGKVTEATRKFDEYAAKMQERIERYSAKKDGQATVARSTKLLENARQEFEALKQKADAAYAKLEGIVGENKAELAGLRNAINAKKSRAEAEADIAGYIYTEKSLDKIQGFLDTLTFRSAQMADRFESRGEYLGYRQAMLDARLREFNKREASYGRQAGREVFKKASEFEKRLDAKLKDLEEFRANIGKRMDERQQLLDQWNNTYQSKIDDAARSFRDESATKFLSMMLEETHMAILEPSLATKAMMDRSLGSGFGSLLIQFKNFPVAYLKQHFFDRSRLAAVDGVWKYRIGLSVLGTLFGGVALALGDIASGRDPREVFNSPKKFASAAFLKGGGLGVANDLIESMTSEFNTDKIARLFGPAAGLFGDLLKIGGTTQKMLHEDADMEKLTNDLSKQLYKVGKENTPFQNFWMTKAVLHNMIIDDLQELANPGYRERSKQRAEKNFGAGYWMDGEDGVRMPDFGNIWRTEGAVQ